MPESLTFINTSPLLYLHQVEKLAILPKLYGTIIAPAAVEQELSVGRERGVDVPELGGLNWLQIQTIESDLTVPNIVDLGRGEAEVIALGLQNPTGLLILDDQLGRRIAALSQLRYTGTLGILVKAKQAGYLTAVSPIVAKLQTKGMWLTPAIIKTTLKLAGEADES
jgi:predicted nucleic acid-binding protein